MARSLRFIKTYRKHLKSRNTFVKNDRFNRHESEIISCRKQKNIYFRVISFKKIILQWHMAFQVLGDMEQRIINYRYMQNNIVS